MKILVKGMHCESCKMLVKMELEECGVGGVIKDITLVKDDIGEITIENVDKSVLDTITHAINRMESYEVEMINLTDKT